MTSPDLHSRLDVQKKLLFDLHSRGKPFVSRKEKVAYCEKFYSSLGLVHGRHIGRIPIHISSSVRHFFHNNIQIGDVPKWARDDAGLMTMFIEVLRIYGPTKAIVKARKATLANPKKIQIIPLPERETFVHLLDGVELSSDEDPLITRTRKTKMPLVSLEEQNAVEDFKKRQEAKVYQLKQMFSLLTVPGVSNPDNPTQVMLQALLLSTAGQISPVPLPTQAPVHSPALSAALSTPSLNTVTRAEEKENQRMDVVPLKHSCTMENILERIKKTKQKPLQESGKS